MMKKDDIFLSDEELKLFLKDSEKFFENKNKIWFKSLIQLINSFQKSIDNGLADPVAPVLFFRELKNLFGSTLSEDSEKEFIKNWMKGPKKPIHKE